MRHLSLTLHHIGKQIDFMAYQLHLMASIIVSVASHYAAKLFLR